jgi:hypothetical protein
MDCRGRRVKLERGKSNRAVPARISHTLVECVDQEPSRMPSRNASESQKRGMSPPPLAIYLDITFI